MPPELGEKCGTECLNTKFPLPAVCGIQREADLFILSITSNYILLIVTVFDASAKSPQGLLFGSSYHMGNFDECVGIIEPGDGMTIEGQYCLATIKWKHNDESKKVRI